MSPETSGVIVHNDPLVSEASRRLFADQNLHRQHFLALLQHFKAEAQDNKVPHLLEMTEMAKILAETAEWFYFGDVALTILQHNALPAVQIMERGLLRMPYPVTVFHHRTNTLIDAETQKSLDCDQARLQSFYFVIDSRLENDTNRFTIDPRITNPFTDGWFMISEFRVETYHDHHMVFSPRLSVITDFRLNQNQTSYCHLLLNDPMGLMKENPYEINSVCDPVAVLNVILNTKNIPVTRTEISPKLNAARAKQRKPPLRGYTTVDTKVYVDAARATIENRASPRMHLRRGHIRHLKDREIWISDMIINADHEPKKREFYQVPPRHRLDS